MTEPVVMRFSDADRVAAQGTLARAVPGRAVPIVLLTDEEVTILDGLAHDQLVPTPWLDAQTDVRSLYQVALRSLIAREMVRSALDEAGDGRVIEAHPGITGPLVLRRTAESVIAIERTTSGGQHWVFLYIHQADGEGVVLEEEISASGQHAFTVYRADLAGERVLPLLDPSGAARADGEATAFSPGEFESRAPGLPAVRDAVAVSVLTGVRRGTDRLVNLTVYASAHGVFVLRGNDRDTIDHGVLTLTEASAKTLKSLTEEVIS